MRPRRSLILALAATAAIAIAALLLQPPGPAPDLAAPPRTGHAPAAAAAWVQAVRAWEATSLGRPLFSRHRRPPPATGPQIAAATTPPPKPRLTGVLAGPFGNRAVFVIGGSGKSVSVQEGEQVGIYRIRRITPGEVLVDGPDGEQVLRPTFGGTTDRQPAPEQRAVRGVPQFLASQR